MWQDNMKVDVKQISCKGRTVFALVKMGSAI
jgi:hypothetical protein